VIIGAALVVLAIIAGSAIYSDFSGSGAGSASSGAPGSGAPNIQVDVTAVNFALSGASNCWRSASGGGGLVAGGGQFSTTWTMIYTAGFLQPSSCTVTSVSVGTAGFSLVNDNVPITVESGGSQTLTVTVTVPDSSFTGVLTIDTTVTSP
jgi:hypothetical protein